jgi:hypothetical protein
VSLEFDEGSQMTGSALLVRVMERFSTDEPRSVIVCFTTENGDVVLMSNTRRVEIVGMLEICKSNMLTMFEHIDNSEGMDDDAPGNG